MTHCKIEGVQGYGTAKAHTGWIPLLMWALGISNDSQDMSHDLAGEVKADTMDARMLTDATVPSLMTKTVTGEIIPLIVIEDCNPNNARTVHRRVTLGNARIKSCTPTQLSEGGHETAFKIIFEKIKLEVRSPAGGMQEASWNNKTKEPRFDD